ncbi:MAG TPA: hypothetical protein VGB55_06505 [Tepidisphaeraceae bacterium]|jgi:hypothetical protein
MKPFRIQVAVALSICIASSVLGETKPSKTDKSDKAGVPPALSAAIETLGNEFEASAKNPSATPLRTNSDYFAADAKGIAADALLDALGKRLHKDPRADAYIKWQLLSAQFGVFEGDNVKTALNLYRRAPRPPARLGSSPEEQSALSSQIKGLRKEQVAEANAKWSEQVERQMQISASALKFRNELYARLPRTPDLFQAALNDADERIQLGYDAGGALKIITGDIRSWAISAKPNAVQNVIRLVRDYAGKQGAKTYREIEYPDNKRAPEWKSGVQSLDKKSLEDLAVDLAQMSRGS